MDEIDEKDAKANIEGRELASLLLAPTITLASQMAHDGLRISRLGVTNTLRLIYAVSLRAEEGRYPEFAIFIPDKSETKISFEYVYSGVELTIGSLHRILPSVPGRPFALVISEKEDKLFIDGVSRIESSGLSVENNGLAYRPPAAYFGLSLFVGGPGWVEAATVNPAGILVHYELKEEKVQKISDWSYSPINKQVFQKIATRITDDPTRRRSVEYLIRGFWVEMLWKAVQLRHGGIFIILPPNFTEQEKDLVLDTGVEIEGLDIGEVVRSWMASSNPSIQGMIDHWKNTTVHLAQLSATDGAVIIDSNLKVLSFRSVIKIQPQQATPNVMQFAPAKLMVPPENPVDLSNFGTRHRSAARFAATVKGAYVVVISQDNETRELYQLDDGTVGVYGPMRPLIHASGGPQ